MILILKDIDILRRLGSRIIAGGGFINPARPRPADNSGTPSSTTLNSATAEKAPAPRSALVACSKYSEDGHDVGLLDSSVHELPSI